MVGHFNGLFSTSEPKKERQVSEADKEEQVNR